MLLERYGRRPRGARLEVLDDRHVSDADREAEEAIRELLEAERPDDGLLAEEGSRRGGRSGRRWVVDPLDGTINYLYGFPAWARQRRARGRRRLAVGVVHDPLRERDLHAPSRGGGRAARRRAVLA